MVEQPKKRAEDSKKKMADLRKKQAEAKKQPAVGPSGHKTDPDQTARLAKHRKAHIPIAASFTRPNYCFPDQEHSCIRLP